MDSCDKFCGCAALLLAVLIGSGVFLPLVSKFHVAVSGTHISVGLNPVFLTTEQHARAAYGSSEMTADL
jgi:hypothetical protein